jgi:elongator complex protein 3
MQPYQRGEWHPYTYDELLSLLTACFLKTPPYCRLTRVIRDIPGTDIVDGNKATNFRQIVDQELTRRGQSSQDIRAREIRNERVDIETLTLDEMHYETSVGDENFLQMITPDGRIAAFLRLSLPPESTIPELAGAGIIREVHVYGQTLDLGESIPGRAQHQGLGQRLIERAAEIAREAGYARLSVISAVGTRAYYRKRGFVDGTLYQTRTL